jgi:beta-galactosidase
LFLNERSLGVRKKQPLDIHVQWRVKYEPGTLKAVSRKNGKTVLTKIIRTAGEPARLEIVPDKRILHADGKDLSFVTIRILDKNGNLVPEADNKITVEIVGEGVLAGMDNGYPASMESFKALSHKAYKGLCLAIIQSKNKAGNIKVNITSSGLPAANVVIQTR